MIKDRMRQYIKETGVKQSFLSQKSGMSPQAISTFMNCKRDLSIDEYYRLCDALGVSYEFFINHKKSA